ncbi:MAG TPA: glycosyl hydrolase, partial [Clostridiales bacterium]|nr:glycosyl hydrolase [Clostridiales bacterium]
MKRKVSVIGLLLALLMILGACGGAEDKPNVGAAETPQPTAEPTQQPTGPGVAA